MYGILYIAEYTPTSYSVANSPKNVIPIAQNTFELSCVKNTYDPLMNEFLISFIFNFTNFRLYFLIAITVPMALEIIGDNEYKIQYTNISFALLTKIKILIVVITLAIIFVIDMNFISCFP